MTTPRDILDFWFAPSDGPDFKESQEKWFSKDAALDAEVARRFLDAHRRAVRHRDIFARFPHRNAILGRDGTAEKRTFLEQPDSSF